MHDLQPLAVQPGINMEQSDYAAAGQYVRGNNVRFRKGFPQKVGGSEPLIDEKLIGAARGRVSWQALDGTPLLAFGTAYGLFVIIGDEVHDITPSREVGSLVNPFSFVRESNVVTVLHEDHGLTTGDRIIFTTPLTMDGIPLEGSKIVTFISDDRYSFELPQPVTFINGVGYGTGVYEITAYGGADQTVYYRIPIASGLPISEVGGGYGEGGYGLGGYGGDVAVRTSGDPARIWSLDSWGEDLVACYYRSPVYQWRYSDGPEVPASVIPNSPAQAGSLFVSQDDRILILLGSSDFLNGEFDPLLVRWSNQENNQEWTPLETNYSGEKRAEKGNRLVGSIETIFGRLILTDTSAYILKFIGQPLIYSLTFNEGNCGLVAPHGIAKIDDIAYWIGANGFFLFDGRVRQMPCNVHEFLFGIADGPRGDISAAQMATISAGSNKSFQEIVWSYASQDEGGVDKTVALQVADVPLWWTGDQACSAWIEDDTYMVYPIGTKEDGTVLIHEYGTDASGQAIPYLLRTADIEIGQSGSFFMWITRFVLDFKRISGNHKLTCIVKYWPTNEEQVVEIIDGPYDFTGLSKEINPRAMGRTVAFELSSDEIGSSFRMGLIRIGGTSAGKKD